MTVCMLGTVWSLTYCWLTRWKYAFFSVKIINVSRLNPELYVHSAGMVEVNTLLHRAWKWIAQWLTIYHLIFWLRNKHCVTTFLHTNRQLYEICKCQHKNKYSWNCNLYKLKHLYKCRLQRMKAKKSLIHQNKQQ